MYASQSLTTRVTVKKLAIAHPETLVAATTEFTPEAVRRSRGVDLVAAVSFSLRPSG